MDNEVMLVQGIAENKNIKTRLNCVIRSSFYLQRDRNGAYQLQFTAYNHANAIGYDLLSTEASIFFQGQEYLIKQVIHDSISGVSTKAVMATHVFNECQYFRKHEVKNGVLTYTPQSIMQFVFDGNSAGFTYEIIGNFPSAQIENLGNMSGLDALNKIVEVWPDAIIDPDNKHIRIYQHDSFAKDYGHRLGYLYNVSESKITSDSTNLSNQVWCIGKAKDKAEGAPDDAPIEYYFDPFMVTDENSVQKWTRGIPNEIATISDERFTDAESMKQYALKQLQVEPSVVIEATTTLYDQPILGDMTHYEVREFDFNTQVEIVGYQWYPWDRTQPATVTLNNLAKTIFDYQRNQQNRLIKDIKDGQNKATNLINSVEKRVAGLGNQVNGLDHVLKGKKLITLGDSITEGWDGHEMIRDKSYPADLKQLLEFEDVTNAGASGGAIYRAINLNDSRDLPHVVSVNDFSKYDLVTIAYGTNDFNINSDGNLMMQTLSDCLLKIKQSNPNIRMFGILATPRFDKTTNGSYTLDNLNDCLAKVYRNNNIPYLDWRNYSPVIFSDENHTGLSDDLLHPTAEGYLMMARQIAKFLQMNY